MSDVGDDIEAANANWRFGGKSAQQFDVHVNRSIPLYQQGHKIICDLSNFFITDHSLCYDLGCATGELTLKLAMHNQHCKHTSFIGLDSEAEMITEARKKKKAAGFTNVLFRQEDILQLEWKQADLISAYYTIQFIRPSQRQRLVDQIYQALHWGGAFLLFEKVRANDARFQDIMTSLYHEYKIDQGYSAQEIFAKTRSLKGVLEPFSTRGNLDMLKRAGFVDIITVFKYLCFEGFLAIK